MVDNMSTTTRYTTIRPSLTFTTTVATSTIQVKEETSAQTSILTALPWLKNVLNDNGILNLPSGW